jgi:DNA-binding NtrC family response regulator
MREVRGRIERIARMERSGGGAPSVLILGETGTGKGLAARSVHQASPRTAGPFIEIHCGGPGAGDLFGEGAPLGGPRAARRGLFEAADHGTIFLDEIGNLSVPAQTALLTIIEEQEAGASGRPVRRADVRILAATNRDLGSAQAAGAFRPELFHRLKVLTIELPPLRDRGDDVILLAEHFARRHAEQYGVRTRRLSGGARDVLFRYAWPGNVRELANEIERAVLRESGDEILLEHLSRSLAPSSRRGSLRAGDDGIEVDLPPEGLAFEVIERRVIERALQLAGGNVTRAARLLRLSRDTLRYRIERLGISPSAES